MKRIEKVTVHTAVPLIHTPEIFKGNLKLSKTSILLFWATCQWNDLSASCFVDLVLASVLHIGTAKTCKGLCSCVILYTDHKEHQAFQH